MAKNSREGNQSRNKRYREALAERGIRPIQVFAPESAHPLIKQAAGLMIRDDDPLEPRAALRRAGGVNEPEPGEALTGLIVELEAAKTRIMEIECQAEERRIEIEAVERQRRVLEAERYAARASEAEERKKVATGAKLVFEAQEKVIEADRKARRAWAPVRRIKTMRGLRGRLARWIADVRPEDPDG